MQEVNGNMRETKGKIGCWKTMVHLVFIGFIAGMLGVLTQQLFNYLFP